MFEIFCKTVFPNNESDHLMTKRKPGAYRVVRASTERFQKSAIPSMVKLLNEHEAKKQKQFKKLSTIITGWAKLSKTKPNRILFHICEQPPSQLRQL